MGTTIDKLDINVNNTYAIRTKMIEQINQQLRLDQAASIPPQTQVVDIYPKLTEMDLLLGIVPYLTPWAYFFPPKKFRFLRRSPFAFYRVAPTLGTLEEQEETEERLEHVETNTPEEKAEKEIIQGCFKQLNKINSWLGFIVGRVGQFLQG
ncbi:MAG: DUF5399 family protein [Chlamydiota bacterium]